MCTIGTADPNLTYVLVGDEAFPLRMYLLHPYSGRNLKEQMAIFNYRLSWARHTVEYAEDHAIMLPGWIPGYKRFDLQLLPCPVTKHSVWKCYKDAADLLQDFRAVYHTPPSARSGHKCFPTFCQLIQRRTCAWSVTRMLVLFNELAICLRKTRVS